jgi:hypothetical protein
LIRINFRPSFLFTLLNQFFLEQLGEFDIRGMTRVYGLQSFL